MYKRYVRGLSIVLSRLDVITSINNHSISKHCTIRIPVLWKYEFSKKYRSLKNWDYILQRAFSYWIFDHFGGFFFPIFFRVIVCVCGRRGFFFSRLSGCCSLYFQWDVLSSLWAKGFFVYLSCSYFTFF